MKGEEETGGGRGRGRGGREEVSGPTDRPEKNRDSKSFLSLLLRRSEGKERNALTLVCLCVVRPFVQERSTLFPEGQKKGRKGQLEEGGEEEEEKGRKEFCLFFLLLLSLPEGFEVEKVRKKEEEEEGQRRTDLSSLLLLPPHCRW